MPCLNASGIVTLHSRRIGTLAPRHPSNGTTAIAACSTVSARNTIHTFRTSISTPHTFIRSCPSTFSSITTNAMPRLMGRPQLPMHGDAVPLRVRSSDFRHLRLCHSCGAREVAPMALDERWRDQLLGVPPAAIDSHETPVPPSADMNWNEGRENCSNAAFRKLHFPVDAGPRSRAIIIGEAAGDVRSEQLLDFEIRKLERPEDDIVLGIGPRTSPAEEATRTSAAPRTACAIECTISP